MISKKFWLLAILVLSQARPVSDLCRVAKKSRQAYYKGLKNFKTRTIIEINILEHVEKIRCLHPKMGVRKLCHVLKNNYNIVIGRDRLFNLLRDYNMLVKRRRRINYRPVINTPRSDNKLVDFVATAPGQVMVTDITYLKSQSRHYYLSLVADAYSRKIIGYNLSSSLDAKESIIALKQAINESGYRYQIHHSDGGIQYSCKQYREFLGQNDLVQSMTKPASPQENPIIERINGILKNEYGIGQNFKDYQQMVFRVNMAINTYNDLRPHWSLNLKTPRMVHNNLDIKLAG